MITPGISNEALEVLGDIFSNTERADKIAVSIDEVSRSIAVVYEDLDEEWLRELREALAPMKHNDPLPLVPPIP